MNLLKKLFSGKQAEKREIVPYQQPTIQPQKTDITLNNTPVSTPVNLSWLEPPVIIINPYEQQTTAQQTKIPFKQDSIEWELAGYLHLMGKMKALIAMAVTNGYGDIAGMDGATARFVAAGQTPKKALYLVINEEGRQSISKLPNLDPNDYPARWHADSWFHRLPQLSNEELGIALEPINQSSYEAMTKAVYIRVLLDRKALNKAMVVGDTEKIAQFSRWLTSIKQTFHESNGTIRDELHKLFTPSTSPLYNPQICRSCDFCR